MNSSGNGANVTVLAVSEADLRSLIRDAVREAVSEQSRTKSPLPFLARDELARQLGVSSATVTRMTAEGMPHRFVGSSPRYVLEDVHVWLAERGRRGTKAAPHKSGSPIPGVRLLSRSKP